MFTGLVEEIGTVERVDEGRVRIGAGRVLEGVSLGDSIAVDGCCLTVVDHGDGWWEADVSDETLARTTLARAAAGTVVNLERPLRLDGRLGGHLVQGHVDGVGEVVDAVPDLRVRVAGDLVPYLVEKGSVAVDGVSLTIVTALADGFTVAVIPHTAAVTTLGRRRPGDPVNVEVDVVAKHVARLLAPYLDRLPEPRPQGDPV